MATEFTSNTFEDDYVLATLGHLVVDLRTDKPLAQILDKYACELTAFMNGQIAQAVKGHNVQIEGLADHKAWPESRKFKFPQAEERTLIGQSRSNAGLGRVLRTDETATQPHVNKRNPISFLVFPFLDCIRLKTQFWVKQQTGNILIET